MTARVLTRSNPQWVADYLPPVGPSGAVQYQEGRQGSQAWVIYTVSVIGTVQLTPQHLWRFRMSGPQPSNPLGYAAHHSLIVAQGSKSAHQIFTGDYTYAREGHYDPEQGWNIVNYRGGNNLHPGQWPADHQPYTGPVTFAVWQTWLVSPGTTSLPSTVTSGVTGHIDAFVDCDAEAPAFWFNGKDWVPISDVAIFDGQKWVRPASACDHQHRAYYWDGTTWVPYLGKSMAMYDNGRWRDL